MTKSSQVLLELLVHKEKNQVVFAEAEADFVDVLLSLLSLPMGTIIRLLEKQSTTIGCMSTLYENVAKLGTKYLQSPECFDMLSRPRSAYEAQCRYLKIKIDDSDPMKYYTCPGSRPCLSRYLSTIEGSRCFCGSMLSEERIFHGENNGLVKEMTKFIITDNLQVMPVSTTATAFNLLKEYSREKCTFAKKTVVVEARQVLLLLKRAMFSNTPLTDVFLWKQELIDKVKLEPIQHSPHFINLRDPTDPNSMKITIKLMERKSMKKILYVEAGPNFMDFLLSFLTFPLGSIIKLLGENFSMGCINNLYKSAKDMSGTNSCLVSMKSRDMLVDPKLPKHYTCQSQLLHVYKEIPFWSKNCVYCHNMIFDYERSQCPHGERVVALNTIDPSNRGRFVKELAYMISDNLQQNLFHLCRVSPLSVNWVFPLKTLSSGLFELGKMRLWLC